MTTDVPTIASGRPKRRWLSPRFSLKMLMLVVTAAAVGAAFWWRWPVTVTNMNGSSVTQKTYHRGLWGNLIRHGMHRTTVDGKLEQEMQYCEGELITCEYRTGSVVLTYEFKNRKLVAAPNRPRGSPALRRMSDAFADYPQLDTILHATVDLDYYETPLQEVVEDLCERFGLSLAIRSKRKDVFDTPITLNVRWPIDVGFDAMLSPLGLMLDCRYGALCIVDADGAAGWQDSTGVMDLQPPDSSLARRLEVPAKITSAQPLLDVLLNLAAHEIPVEFRSAKNSASDASSVLQREEVGSLSEVLMIRSSQSTAPGRSLPITLRQLLGLVLNQAELQCREEKGMLIIEPQQKDAISSAKTAPP